MKWASGLKRRCGDMLTYFEKNTEAEGGKKECYFGRGVPVPKLGKEKRQYLTEPVSLRRREEAESKAQGGNVFTKTRIKITAVWKKGSRKFTQVSLSQSRAHILRWSFLLKRGGGGELAEEKENNRTPERKQRVRGNSVGSL